MRRGVTLIEVCIVVAILGATVLVVKTGLGFLMTIFSQTTSIQAQQEAEVTMYDIAKEVRNAKAILQISSGTLVLKSLNTQLGYDSDTSPIFSGANIGTVTYQYEQIGGSSHLKRSKEFNGLLVEKKFLKGFLPQPGSNNYIFRPMNAFSGVDPWTIEPPFDGVDVMLEVKSPGSKSPPKIFHTQVPKRSQSF